MPFFEGVTREGEAPDGRDHAVRLVRGVLYAWLEPDRRWQVDDRASLDGLLTALVCKTQRTLGFASIENMLLALTDPVRVQNGRLPAFKMLMAGHNIDPASAAIRSRLIMDLWPIVKASDRVDRGCAFDLIRRLYDGIAPGVLERSTLDVVDYIYFVALSYLGEYERRDRLFWQVIAKRSRHRKLRHRMIELIGSRSAGSAPAVAARR
jgi:hypothetical protein